MTGYIVVWNAHGPGYAPNWVQEEKVYLNARSANQRACRIKQKGIANPFSGCGKIIPGDVYIKKVQVI